MFPKQLSVALRETDHALGAGNLAAGKWIAAFGAINLPPVHHINTTVGHGGSGVTESERHPPADDGTILGKFLKQSILAPNGIAFGPEPLRPVVGVKDRAGNDEKKK